MATERITLSMSTTEIIMALAEGNPGALRVCSEVLNIGDRIDPDAGPMGGFGALLHLDSLGIYGHRIWSLYKDVCNESLITMLAVLRGWQMGKLGGATREAIDHAIDNRGEGLDTTLIVTEVQTALPNFGVR